MKAESPPESHTKLPQAGESLRVQEADFTFTRTQPQQGQKVLLNREEESFTSEMLL